MIKVKHLMDNIENDDGRRIWVEPIGLTHDLREWCGIDHVLPHLGPHRKLWCMLDEHPDSYDYFRAQYHEQLRRSPYRVALQSLACAARHENITLIHNCEDAEHNCAMALYEYLSDLEAYCPPE